MEQFYQEISLLPTNIDIGVLQIGRQTDFLDECTYLKMAIDFVKKINKNLDQPLNEDNFTEFSNYLNAPMGNKTRHKIEKIQMKETFSHLDFPDVGDDQSVIFATIQLNRKNIDEKILQELEQRVQINRDQNIRKRIEKFTQIEQEKEHKLKDLIEGKFGLEFYQQYFEPDNRYCYMRALALYYYNIVTPDKDKTDLKMEFNFLSYLNFHYPHGNLSGDVNQKQTFQDIQEVVNYLDDTQAKQFLEKMQLDMPTLKKKVEQEKEEQYQHVGKGLLE